VAVVVGGVVGRMVGGMVGDTEAIEAASTKGHPRALQRLLEGMQQGAFTRGMCAQVG
jgi:hypothetical protein